MHLRNEIGFDAMCFEGIPRLQQSKYFASISCHLLSLDIGQGFILQCIEQSIVELHDQSTQFGISISKFTLCCTTALRLPIHCVISHVRDIIFDAAL